MSIRNITVLTDASLITCIVQRGLADEIIKAAEEAGAQGATTFYGRGTGVRERLGVLGVAIEVEKEIISIIVSNEQRDRVFETIFLEAKLDTPGMGLMYMMALDKVATFIPNEVIQKLEKDNAS